MYGLSWLLSLWSPSSVGGCLGLACFRIVLAIPYTTLKAVPCKQYRFVVNVAAFVCVCVACACVFGDITKCIRLYVLWGKVEKVKMYGERSLRLVSSVWCCIWSCVESIILLDCCANDKRRFFCFVFFLFICGRPFGSCYGKAASRRLGSNGDLRFHSCLRFDQKNSVNSPALRLKLVMSVKVLL